MLSEHFEEELIDVLLTMIKPKFAFFQMEIEGVLMKAPEADKAGFGKGLKTFYPIDM